MGIWEEIVVVVVVQGKMWCYCYSLVVIIAVAVVVELLHQKTSDGPTWGLLRGAGF